MKALKRIAALAALASLPAAAEAACKIDKLAELPVTMTSGYKPMVSARIDGMDAQFIADSGAFYSLISPGVAAAAGLHTYAAPHNFRLSGIGGETNASVAKVKDFTLAGLPIHNIEFLVGGTDFGNAGLIGQNVLGLADVEYDLPHGAIRLMRSHDCGGSDNLAYWVDKGGIFSMMKIMSLTEARFHTVGTVTVNGQALRAGFDTGAGRTMLTRKAAARLGVKPDSPGVIEAGASHGLGRRIARSWIAPFQSIRIGDEEIRNIRLFIADTELGEADMLIGADFFISHRVYVDNAAHRIFFTYTGGKVFDSNAHRDGEKPAAAAAEGAPAAAAAQPAAEAGAPTDADGFSRRGGVYLAQRDFPRAIADFTRAVELAPKEPRFLIERAEAYVRSGRRALGLADLDRALAIAPTSVGARIHRAQMRLSADRAGAQADADAAGAAIVGPVNERLALANLYLALDAYDRAIAQLDPWIAAHPDDVALPVALNDRCWARTLAGKELDRALSDCNAALRRRPKTPAYLGNRGLVRLRMGDYDRAIEDFDAALGANPALPWASTDAASPAATRA
ncbi:MAG TPA: tetratricopeptide repeat protein [Allosphingosinicella sp.]|jgi:tetratricopeptide (TPR) repeat protein